MELALKYRIVGVAVLLSLAVIFLPLVLDGSGKQQVARIDLDIPEEPRLIFSDELLQDAKEPASQYAKPKPVAPNATEIDIENQIVPEVVVAKNTPAGLLGWVVQVGAFSEKEKALTMQESLVGKGFDSFVELYSLGDKPMYRVKVGPMISQDDAVKSQAKLQQQLKLDSTFVTRHPRAEQ